MAGEETKVRGYNLPPISRALAAGVDTIAAAGAGFVTAMATAPSAWPPAAGASFSGDVHLTNSADQSPVEKDTYGAPEAAAVAVVGLAATAFFQKVLAHRAASGCLNSLGNGQEPLSLRPTLFDAAYSTARTAVVTGAGIGGSFFGNWLAGPVQSDDDAISAQTTRDACAVTAATLTNLLFELAEQQFTNRVRADQAGRVSYQPLSA